MLLGFYNCTCGNILGFPPSPQPVAEQYFQCRVRILMGSLKLKYPNPAREVSTKSWQLCVIGNVLCITNFRMGLLSCAS